MIASAAARSGRLRRNDGGSSRSSDVEAASGCQRHGRLLGVLRRREEFQVEGDGVGEGGDGVEGLAAVGGEEFRVGVGEDPDVEGEATGGGGGRSGCRGV